jgi:hypothetical protein
LRLIVILGGDPAIVTMVDSLDNTIWADARVDTGVGTRVDFVADSGVGTRVDFVADFGVDSGVVVGSGVDFAGDDLGADFGVDFGVDSGVVVDFVGDFVADSGVDFRVGAGVDFRVGVPNERDLFTSVGVMEGLLPDRKLGTWKMGASVSNFLMPVNTTGPFGGGEELAGVVVTGVIILCPSLFVAILKDLVG